VTPKTVYELLTPEQAAEFLTVPVGTLGQWRIHGRGPTYRKIGQAVRYAKHDLIAFIEAGAVTPGAVA
jgi:Helix-turn-helix domain